MRLSIICGLLAALLAAPAAADSTEALCEIYPAGSDTLDKMGPCTFSQRQGHVTILRDDGVTHDLTPTGDTPGNFLDQDGHAAYRQSGLGSEGLIFRLRDESVFVYWDTSALDPETDTATAPFSTSDYDATTLLRCRGVDAADFASCPAGILRMEDNQASIVVHSPAGEEFTINFMTDYVNATNREAEARLEGDTWVVVIDGSELYEVPLAAIEGG